MLDALLVLSGFCFVNIAILYIGVVQRKSKMEVKLPPPLGTHPPYLGAMFYTTVTTTPNARLVNNVEFPGNSFKGLENTYI